MGHFLGDLQLDRRMARRHVLKTALCVRVRRSAAAEMTTESEDVSQRGVFFKTDLRISEGAALDLLVDMPEAVTGVAAAQWLCTGHVVRVVPAKLPEGSRGVGVQFDFYEVSRARRPSGPLAWGCVGRWFRRTKGSMQKTRSPVARQTTTGPMNRTKKFEPDAALGNGCLIHPKLFVFFDKKTGIQRFEVEAGQDGSMPIEQAVNLLAIHCVARQQIPSDFDVLIGVGKDLVGNLVGRVARLMQSCSVGRMTCR